MCKTNIPTFIFQISENVVQIARVRKCDIRFVLFPPQGCKCIGNGCCADANRLFSVLFFFLCNAQPLIVAVFFCCVFILYPLAHICGEFCPLSYLAPTTT
eukprot:GEMP01055753.1.p1 GENE.GEMP01055753.1~~GEMP01055753.1.p1  ORF type:complete len:100 (+),score=0.62 GEMP01055753.1:827-1126(+)